MNRVVPAKMSDAAFLSKNGFPDGHQAFVAATYQTCV